ncbi:MAG: hypothetical protein ACRDOY_07140 [Nocardioidaceae bacterium]
MVDSVYLHVGTPKSGTTYLQAVLAANRERLAAEARLLYAGKTWTEQVRAARDAVGANPHGDHDPAVEGAWQRLADEIAAWDGDAVVSMEWLGSAGPQQARRMVNSLRPAQVEVLISARDLVRTIPAAWQEFVQNWHTWTWEEFLNAITADNPKSTAAGRLFWTQQDLTRLFSIWRDVLPAQQLHLVTLPPSGAPPAELWSRFASVLRIDPRRFDSTGGAGNESLGLESTALMLRLNEASRRDNLPWEVYNDAFKNILAKRGLSARRPNESSLALPKRVNDWVAAYSKEQIEAVKASGAHVVGDLADLEPRSKRGGRQPTSVSDTEVLDVAVDALVFLARNRNQQIDRLRANNAQLRKQVASQRGQVEDLRAQLDERRRRFPAVRARARGLLGAGAPGEPPRVRKALLDLSERYTWAMRLRKLVHAAKSRY